MDLWKEFKEPDSSYSALAFWFLNGRLEPEELERQIKEMTEKGIMGGFLHPRAYLKTPYLEEEWWEAIRTCVEASGKWGFKPWLYDEYAWPSGTAGSTFEYGYQKPSRILAEGQCNMAKGLYARVFKQKEDSWEAYKEEETDKVFRVIKKNGSFYVFYRRVYQKAVDYLNADTIAQFIRLTHEEYKKRFGEDFGSLIPGIFFDEIFMAGAPLPWTDKFPVHFLEKYGYSIEDSLISLIEGEEEKDKKVRQDYYSLLGELYENAFFKQISDWCSKNRLKLTGHTEEFLWEHPRRQGDYFKTMRHLMIPGSDCHDYRYRYPRKITYYEPKYSVSVARAYGKERAMTEAMGGAGWNCTLQEFKRGVNALGVMGSSMFILHGFYYECEHQGSQSDWPTSFFFQNPYWKYFKIFAGYMKRISYMNSIGRADVRCGLLYPIEEMQANMADGEENAAGEAISQGFHKALEAMIENQLDTDFIDQERIIQADIKDGLLCVGQQQFKVLLVPQGTVLAPETGEKLKSWLAAGGHILVFSTGLRNQNESKLPGQSCTIEDLPRLAESIISPDALVIDGKNRDILMSRRISGHDEFYLIANNGEERRRLGILFKSEKNPVLLDIETGAAIAGDFVRREDGAVLTLILEPSQAVYVVLKGGLVKSIPSSQYEKAETVTGKWKFLPLDKSFDEKWETGGEYSELEIPVAGFTSDISSNYDRIRICNTKAQEGSCKRHLSLWEASWITRRASWNDQLDASVLYFRKELCIQNPVLGGKLCLSAVDSAQVFVNGKLIYEGSPAGEPVDIQLPQVWQKGKNIIGVRVENHRPLQDVYVCSVEELPKDRFISLLLQGEILTASETIKIKTDRTWLVNDEEEAGWNRTESVKVLDFDVQKVKNFNKDHPGHGWLSSWERGRPPVSPWGEVPLFGKKTEYPRKLYYTFTIPAGVSQIKRPVISGTGSFLLDGKPVVWEEEVLVLPDWEDSHVLNIQVTAFSGEDGVKQPLGVVFEKRESQLEDWRIFGLDWFSGRCLYQNSWNIKKETGKRYILDLGRVNHCAEIWINKTLAGTRLWSPYEADVTDLIKDGDNEISVIASNLASNERRNMLVDEGMALGWNRYWNQDNMDRDGANYVSGLLGPVTILKSL